VIGVLTGLVVVALAGVARAAVVAARRQAVHRRLGEAAGAPSKAIGAALASTLPDPPSWVGRRLEDAGVEIDPRTAWWGWAFVSPVLVLAVAVVAGVGTAGLVALILVATPLVVMKARRGQGRLRVERDLPAALEAIARSLRSGASVRQALAEAGVASPGRLGRELLTVAGRVEHGEPLVSALESLVAGPVSAGLRLAVAALCLGVETGGAQARAIDGVASTLRDRLAVAGELRALSSQARMSALVIGLAPVAFGGFAIATDPRTGTFLFHTPLGITLLALGCALDAVGWLWMQRLVRAPA
jgi:tight adherence protein B